MRRFRNHISVAFLALAALGIMLSMAHYHSNGLECLHHADDQHITQNELLCPVSGIAAVTNDEIQPSLGDFLKFQDILIDIHPLYLSTKPFVPLLGRAPPSMI